jgi:hypothetical protein
VVSIGNNWKKAASSIHCSRIFPGGTKKNVGEPQTGLQVSRSRFEPDLRNAPLDP